MPTNIGVIDTMLDLPTPEMGEWYRFLEPQLREESKDYEFPAQYMFKDVPHVDGGPDPVATVLRMMDHHGIERAMIGVSMAGPDDTKVRALRDHPDRFVGSAQVDPNTGMAGITELVRTYETLGVRAATAFPAGCLPQVPIADKRFFPFYAKCVELDLPIFVCTGICGPRVPSACQDTALIDEVCDHFPELVFVMRHGAEPWTDLAVKLLLKWPNLYYSTSAFAPKYYPKAIIDFANTRGADKVMYAGYFPMGLGLDVIFDQLPHVPLRDEVWPKFLHDNAAKVLKL